MAVSSTPNPGVGLRAASRAGLGEFLSECIQGIGSLAAPAFPGIVKLPAPGCQTLSTASRIAAACAGPRRPRRCRARSSPRAVLPSRMVPSSAQPQASWKRHPVHLEHLAGLGCRRGRISRSVARYRCSTSLKTPGELKYAAEAFPAGWRSHPLPRCSSRCAVSSGGSSGSSFPAGSSQSQPLGGMAVLAQAGRPAPAHRWPPPRRHRDGAPARAARDARSAESHHRR